LTGTIIIVSPPRHPQFINVLSMMLKISDKTVKNQLNLTSYNKIKPDVISCSLYPVSFYFVVDFDPYGKQTNIHWKERSCLA